MDIDQLKHKWNDIELPDSAAERRVKEMERRVSANKVPTLRDKLYRLFIRMVAVSFFGILTLVPFTSDSPGLVIAASAFFVVMGLANFYQALAVRRIDIGHISVREALEKVYKVEKRKMLSRTFGITCAIPLLFFMVMTFSDIYGSWALYGCMVGIMIGGCLGLLINHHATMLLQEMKSQLKKAEDGD